MIMRLLNKIISKEYKNIKRYEVCNSFRAMKDYFNQERCFNFNAAIGINAINRALNNSNRKLTLDDWLIKK